MSIEVREPAERTKAVRKKDLTSYGLVDPSKHVDQNELYEGSCFVLGTGSEWCFDISERLKTGSQDALKSVSGFMMSQIWNSIGLGICAAQEEKATSKKFYELGDSNKFSYYGALFEKSKCLDYALRDYTSTDKDNLIKKLSDMVTEAYNDALENNAEVMTDKYEQTAFFGAFFDAGWNICMNKPSKKKGFFSKLFKQ